VEKSKELTNWHSRLQKLKEKKALYGMDAPPQLDIEIEDIEEKIKELELEENIEKGIASVMPGGDPNSSQDIDPILKGFVSTFTKAGLEMPITLFTTNGLVVSGFLVSGLKWAKGFLGAFTDIESLDLNKLEELENPDGSSEAKADSDPSYIHLQSAQVYTPNYMTISSTESWNIFWRGKLSSIESFIPGQLTGQTEQGKSSISTVDAPDLERNYLKSELRDIFEISNKTFDETSLPQKIIVEFTNLGKETICVKEVKYSDTGLGLPQEALLSTYKRAEKGRYIIDDNKKDVKPGQKFSVELCLGATWKKEDINKWAGDWGYLRLTVDYKGEEIELFESI
jgi:hypothetical protein